MLTTNSSADGGRRGLQSSAKRRNRRPIWDTASSGLDPDTSPMELDALDRHAHTCARSKGFWFATMGRLDALAAFAVARPIGTLMAVAALVWALVS